MKRSTEGYVNHIQARIFVASAESEVMQGFRKKLRDSYDDKSYENYDKNATPDDHFERLYKLLK